MQKASLLLTALLLSGCARSTADMQKALATSLPPGWTSLKVREEFDGVYKFRVIDVLRVEDGFCYAFEVNHYGETGSICVYQQQLHDRTKILFLLFTGDEPSDPPPVHRPKQSDPEHEPILRQRARELLSLIRQAS